MTDKTKAVNLTQDEIMQLVEYHGKNVANNFSDRVERLGYLHKRLKSFNEPDTEQPKAEIATEQKGSTW